MNRTSKCIVLLFVIGLSSCAHVRLEQWAGDQYKLCGNAFADQSDYEAEAAKRCGGKPARAIAGGIEGTGAVQFSPGLAQQVKHQCVVYECTK